MTGSIEGTIALFKLLEETCQCQLLSYSAAAGMGIKPVQVCKLFVYHDVNWWMEFGFWWMEFSQGRGGANSQIAQYGICSVVQWPYILQVSLIMETWIWVYITYGIPVFSNIRSRASLESGMDLVPRWNRSKTSNKRHEVSLYRTKWTQQTHSMYPNLWDIPCTIP